MIGIQANSLSKRFDKTNVDVLKNISFEFLAQEKIGILGPNGAGKTTLISILCGIIEQSAGEVIYSQNLATIHYEDFKKNLGFVPQELAFYHELSPIQNLNYFGKMYGMTSSEIDKKSEEILSLLGLIKVKNNKSETFSGGMKRRLNLAISILHDPKILFLDEPTVGIDVQSKNAIITLLNDLNKKGTTIIYTSHHLNEAELLCDKVLLLDLGKIIDFDSIENLKSKTKLNTLEEVFLNLTGTEYRD